MALTTSSNRVVATGDNVTTRFYFNRLLYDAAHLQVYLDASLQVAGYTVGGVVDPWTANHVDFSVAPGTGVQVLLLRVVPLTQLSVYAVAGAFPAKTTEKNFDLAVMALQQFDETLDRAITLPIESTLTAADIPDPADPLNYGLGLKIKGDGTGIDTFVINAGDIGGALTTKGDVLGYSAAASRIPVGTNGQVLQADSTQGLGLKWTSDQPDNVFRVVGADATKKVALEVDGLTTATTRTHFVVDEDFNSGQSWEVKNLTLTATVAASALTVAIKTKGGGDASATNPILFKFRNAAAGTGDYTTVALTAALSLVASSGSTLGTVSGVAHRLYVGVANDGGTLRLFVYNPYNTATGPPVIHSLIGLQDDLVYSSTAEGGAGGADSAQVLYSSTAFSSKAIKILGYIESTQATAGTWATTPSKIHLLKLWDKRTGDIIQGLTNQTGAVATGATTIPNDDSIPQNTEGNEYMSQAITPTSAINLISISVRMVISSSGAAPFSLILALFQDSTASAFAAITETINATQHAILDIDHTLLAGGTASTTFKARGGCNSAGTTTFNGIASGRTLGGAMASSFSVREIMV